jgi:hypothetical protein
LEGGEAHIHAVEKIDEIAKHQKRDEVTRNPPHGALFNARAIRSAGCGVAIGGISPGIFPWDAAHVFKRFVVPLRKPKNYGIKFGIVIAKLFSL